MLIRQPEPQLVAIGVANRSADVEITVRGASACVLAEVLRFYADHRHAEIDAGLEINAPRFPRKYASVAAVRIQVGVEKLGVSPEHPHLVSQAASEGEVLG